MAQEDELDGILVAFRFHILPRVAFYVVHVSLLMFELTIQTLYEYPIQINFCCSLLFVKDSKSRTQKFQNTVFFIFSLCKSGPTGLVTSSC